MKVLFITNLPSPYRVDFFNELGKFCDLTVCYERKSAADRDEKWVGCGAETYAEMYAKGISIAADKSMGTGIIEVIRSNKFDALVIAGYSSPSVMLAITYCKLWRVPFFMEYDGGFDRTDSKPMRALKQFLLCSAQGHFTTCQEHKRYLQKLGIPEEKIYCYPFTSVSKKDVLDCCLTKKQKSDLKRQLNIPEKKVVIAVGQFIPRKGLDILLAADKSLGTNIGVYVVGGTPTPEYLEFVNHNGLKNVHFLNFMKRAELFRWYQAADVFVLPTREDIWGLVVNEAMANGLPVITTMRCIAGQELIENGKNGFLIPVNDPKALSGRMLELIGDDEKCATMAEQALRRIGSYTIEKMAQVHLDILKELCGRKYE